MSRLIRREALTLFAGTSVGALLGIAGEFSHASGFPSQNSPGAAMLQGTLTSEHIDGRRMIGFLETGIENGHTLCTLVRQDDRNPAVQSVFAAPARRAGLLGIEVTVSFFTEPVGDITFSLLHVSAAAVSSANRNVPAGSTNVVSR